MAKLIGQLRNNWRQRFVEVFETDDPIKVETVGWPYAGGDPIRCVEARELYTSAISQFPKIAVYD